MNFNTQVMLQTISNTQPLEWVFYVFIFVSGLFIGSFLNVVCDRVVNGESILLGRSHCDNCKKPLSPKQLIPVLSFILSKGRCSYCNAKISWYYPASELLTGALFMFIAYYLQVFTTSNTLTWLYFIYYLIIISVYIVIILTDAKYRLIPNKIVYPAIIFVFLFTVGILVYTLGSFYLNLKNDVFGQYLLQAGYFSDQAISYVSNYLYTLVSTLGLGLFFYILTKIKDGNAMGGGDVKLAILIGLVNGWPTNVIAIFMGFVFGAFYSLFMIAIKKKSMKDTIAFGPFLILGSLFALVFGDYVVRFLVG